MRPVNSTTYRVSVAAVFAVLVLTGCSPSLSPLYRDFEHNADTDDVRERVERALTDANWQIDSSVDQTLITTESRTFKHWLLYRVEASLQVTEVDGDYVRVLINPYRVYFTGRRSKVPYLKKRLGRSVMRDFQRELDQEGLVAIGTVVERDKEDTDDS
ncbi:MAG: hypothetical protein HKN43_08415 [Rhodothermales bacterium]|nr:hypothetical protein [Rhodothermales bacterium]